MNSNLKYNKFIADQNLYVFYIKSITIEKHAIYPLLTVTSVAIKIILHMAVTIIDKNGLEY